MAFPPLVGSDTVKQTNIGSPGREITMDEIAAFTRGGVAVTTQTGTTYTLAIGDAGSYSQQNNASAITVTIPTNASVAFTVGTVIALEQTGAGAVTVVGADGVALNYYSPSSAESCVSVGKSAVIQLVKTGTNAWTASGGNA